MKIINPNIFLFSSKIWWERQSEIKKYFFKIKHYPNEDITPKKINQLYIIYTCCLNENED